MEWRIHKTAAFVVLGFTLAALLGIGINLEDKIFNLVSWKNVIICGQLYMAWVFKNLLNY